MSAFIDTNILEGISAVPDSTVAVGPVGPTALILLEQMEDLLAPVTGEALPREKGKGAVREDFITALLKRLPEADEAKRGELISSLGDLIAGYKDASQETRSTLLTTLMPLLEKEARAHPENAGSLLRQVAPLLPRQQVEMTEQLKKLAVLCEKLQELTADEDPEVLEEQTSTFLAQILGGGKGKELEKVLQQLTPYADSATVEDIQDITALLHEGKEETAVRLSAKFPALKATFMQHVTAAPPAPTPSDTTDYNHINGLLMMYLSQVQSMITESQANQDTAQLKIGALLMSAASATQVRIDKEVTKEIADAQKAQAHQHRPWWAVFVEVVSVIVSVVVGALTGGVGGALIAVVLGVLMTATPLFNMAASAIGNDIGGKAGQIIGILVMTLVVVVLSAGASAGAEAISGAAEEAAVTAANRVASAGSRAFRFINDASPTAGAALEAVGNAIGAIVKVISDILGKIGDVLEATAALIKRGCRLVADLVLKALKSLAGAIKQLAVRAAAVVGQGATAARAGGAVAIDGAGGAVGGAGGAGTDGVAGVPEGDAPDAAGGTASRSAGIASRAGKVAAMGGLGYLAQSNIAFDLMMLDPTWVKKHETVAIILSVLATVVLIIATMGAAKVCMNAFATMEGEGSTVSSSLLGKLSILFKLDWISQTGSNFYTAIMSWLAAGELMTAGKYLKQIGQDQAELKNIQTELEMNQQAIQVANNSANSISKGEAETIKLLGDTAGLSWGKLDGALRS